MNDNTLTAVFFVLVVLLIVLFYDSSSGFDLHDALVQYLMGES